MKKYKLLLSLPILGVVATTPLVLCQCNNDMTTITFIGTNATVKPSSLRIDKTLTWADAKAKVTSTPYYGFSTVNTWKNGKTLEVLNDSDVIGEIKSVVIEHNNKRDATDKGTITVGTKTNGTTEISTGHDTYTTSDNITTGNVYNLKYVEYSTDSTYKFSISLVSITKIKYFYLFFKEKNNSMFKFKDTNNIILVKHGSDTLIQDTDFTIKPWGNGSYIEFKEEYSSGTIDITLEFHEDTTINLIPIFESTTKS